MAVDMFIKIGDIKGESKDATHKESIDVLAWSWGLSQSGTFATGGGGGAGKVNVQDISLTKYVDSSSTALMLAACKGTHIKQAVLTVRKAGDKPLEYIKITLDSVLVSSLSTGGSGGEDRLTENVSLNFAKFKVEYTQQAETGGKGTTSTAAWNITSNEAIG
jgi:type VI secretion system secreted protein Hcp